VAEQWTVSHDRLKDHKKHMLSVKKSYLKMEERMEAEKKREKVAL
jgi:hypothetical protein